MSAAHRLTGLAGHPVAIVGGIVLGCFAITTHYVSRVDDWRVMTDELLYVKLARSIADGFSPLPEVSGEYMPVFSQLFPLLLAPFAGLLSAPAAYEAGLVLNALLMASAAVPAYLLVRSLGLPRLAGYLVAALTVFIPWLGMATILWTEAVGYPAFLWAILAIHRAVVSPSARNDLFVLGGLALAFTARTQFVFLVGVLPLAVLLHEGGYGARARSTGEAARRVVRAARSHRVLVVAYGVLAVGAGLLAVTGGLDAALGTYSGTVHGDLWPEGAWAQIWTHAASVTVAIGVIPAVLALGWAVASVVRPSSRELHAFAVIVVLVVPLLLLIVASFTARYSPGYLQNRYLFYVVPLLFAGMAACLLDPRRRWIAVAVAGIAFYLIADSVSYAERDRTLWFASPATWFWKVLEGRAWQLGSTFGIDHLSPVGAVEIGTLLSSAVLAALLRWRMPSRALLLGVAGLVLLFCFIETNYVLNRGSNASGGGNIVTGDIPLHERDWIDEALPDGAEAGILSSSVGNDEWTSQRIWWQAEFWNKRVTRQVRAQGEGAYTVFPRKEMSVDFATGRVQIEGNEPAYLVVAKADGRFRLATTRSLAEGFEYLELIEPVRPYRAVWTSRGIGADGWATTNRPQIRVHGHDVVSEGEARRVTLTLSAPSSGLRYRVSGGVRPASGELAPGQMREVTMTECMSPGKPNDVKLEVGRESTADDRAAGLRVLSIDVAAASSRACH